MVTSPFVHAASGASNSQKVEGIHSPAVVIFLAQLHLDDSLGVVGVYTDELDLLQDLGAVGRDLISPKSSS